MKSNFMKKIHNVKVLKRQKSDTLRENNGNDKLGKVVLKDSITMGNKHVET